MSFICMKERVFVEINVSQFDGTQCQVDSSLVKEMCDKMFMYVNYSSQYSQIRKWIRHHIFKMSVKSKYLLLDVKHNNGWNYVKNVFKKIKIKPCDNFKIQIRCRILYYSQLCCIE